MKSLKHVAKEIAKGNGIPTEEHAQVIAKGHVKNTIKLAKAKQARKEAAKPKPKKTTKKSK